MNAKPPNVKILIATFLFLSCAGCATNDFQTKLLMETLAGKFVSAEAESLGSGKTSEGEILFPANVEIEQESSALLKSDESLTVPGSPGNTPHIPSPETQKKVGQEMLDCALEFCQASSDFWEQGDLDNALDALDEAYSLILRVIPDRDPEILQQRDDLRFTISKRIIECRPGL